MRAVVDSRRAWLLGDEQLKGGMLLRDDTTSRPSLSPTHTTHMAPSVLKGKHQIRPPRESPRAGGIASPNRRVTEQFEFGRIRQVKQ